MALMLATICKHVPHLHTAEAVNSSSGVALRSAASQLYVACVSESSRQKVCLLYSNNTILEDQYELENRHDGRHVTCWTAQVGLIVGL